VKASRARGKNHHRGTERERRSDPTLFSLYGDSLLKYQALNTQHPWCSDYQHRTLHFRVMKKKFETEQRKPQVGTLNTDAENLG